LNYKINNKWFICLFFIYLFVYFPCLTFGVQSLKCQFSTVAKELFNLNATCGIVLSQSDANVVPFFH